ncbi:MAG TPA: hypothetical protein VFN67_42400 [Polyangiales bacterium]|nr:hypothetical protein [Polyangiales bacterium]
MQLTTTQSAHIEPTAEEKELDRKLIAAFMSSNQDLLSALYREESSIEAVNARAAGMGLTSELIKRCRLIGTLPAMRRCIKCDARFLSAGPQNRLCKRCPPR